MTKPFVVEVGASSGVGDELADSRLEVTDNDANLPHPDNLELANSVLNRLQPKDHHEMGQMIHSLSLIHI